MKVAIVHYWLVRMRGGEKVLESLCRLYPQADIFTHCIDREQISDLLKERVVKTTFINNLPFAVKYYKHYLPLMPLALEQLDLRGYDLVISSESGPAKGVIVDSEAKHVCYCHTPMRYLWDFYRDYLESKNIFTRAAMRPVFHYMRMWDVASAAHPDSVVANSKAVALRTRRCWGRSAQVVYPPVDVDSFAPKKTTGDYYLCLGQLVDYKRVDLAARVATKTGRKLIVVGEGEAYAKLRRLSGPTVEFAGSVSTEEKKELLAGCRALLFPGEEDFGIVPIEAMASGRPVVAYGKGGALETVVDGKTGLFFSSQDTDSLLTTLQKFEKMENSFQPQDLVKHASQFNEGRFHKDFSKVVKDLNKKE